MSSPSTPIMSKGLHPKVDVLIEQCSGPVRSRVGHSVTGGRRAPDVRRRPANGVRGASTQPANASAGAGRRRGLGRARAGRAVGEHPKHGRWDSAEEAVSAIARWYTPGRYVVILVEDDSDVEHMFTELTNTVVRIPNELTDHEQAVARERFGADVRTVQDLASLLEPVLDPAGRHVAGYNADTEQEEPAWEGAEETPPSLLRWAGEPEIRCRGSNFRRRPRPASRICGPVNCISLLTSWRSSRDSRHGCRRRGRRSGCSTSIGWCGPGCRTVSWTSSCGAATTGWYSCCSPGNLTSPGAVYEQWSALVRRFSF